MWHTSRISEGQRWYIAFQRNTLIGAGEWVRCEARGSVGPEMYVAGYFEDHARLRTKQIARYRAPPPIIKRHGRC
jgi:hypothetical protein